CVTVASLPELPPMTFPSDFSSANLKVGSSFSDKAGSGTLFMKLGSPAAAGCAAARAVAARPAVATSTSRRCMSDMDRHPEVNGPVAPRGGAAAIRPHAIMHKQHHNDNPVTPGYHVHEEPGASAQRRGIPGMPPKQSVRRNRAGRLPFCCDRK